MENNTQTNSSSTTTLIVGIVLGVLILGGIFLYMRGTTAKAPSQAPTDSIEADINIPIRNDGEQTENR